MKVIGLVEGDVDGTACGATLGLLDGFMDDDVDGAMVVASTGETVDLIVEGS